ncbi:TonB-dependent receptor domain-containing protein [Stutzerimonas kirkiae]|uniref:TonB-dependent receptor n=1 Tax=Stutzerimonas kirkiae TaxID=2211392 RepID=A0A4Q9R2J7_9GAMM|nr:TonB-dependent receptor [Stutzerimonas kirkiae]TBU92651.1 TonB-dependent receptor [Stutzerimonas kirkiae]TBV00843.1 TonB-dependent receptor [Stutzerimonas kirkiae]TBV08734.1 TonB-dependent receptor [Stutzerimonas kirkiae]TBV11482.1 TonB-dependent receptor [Stutzerimonas kirkiae]
MSRTRHPLSARRQPQFNKTLLAAAMTSLACSAFAEEQVDLGPVVVSASGFEQSVKDAPATISVITAEELKKKSYTDITDALKNVAGVQIAGGGVEQSIMIRGMSSDYTLFLIDGRPAQSNDAFGLNGAQAGTPINFLPPIEAIERIEIIRGPASSLYGSDAMGGVINIITKKIRNEWAGSITSEYTLADSSNDINEDGFQTSVYLNAPLIEDVLALQLTGAFQNQDESNFVGGSDSASSDPEFKKKNAGAKLGWNINDQNMLTLGHGYTVQERWHNPGKSLADGADETYSKSVKKNYYVSHEGNYENLLWNSYVNYDTSENPTRVNATTGNSIEYDVLTVNSQASYFFGSHTVTGGLTHKYEELEDGATSGLAPPVVPVANAIVKMDRYQNSIFLEDNWSLTDDLLLTLSGRYDDNQKFGGQFSPKVYAVYHLTNDFTLKGGITSGYKAPNLRQSATDYGSTSMGGVIIGNPDLTPETSLNREFGIGYENFELGLSGTLTVYKTDYEDKINRTGRVCLQNVPCVYNGTTYPAHQYGYTAYENVDKAELKGVEFTLDYHVLDNLVYRHSYTYTSTEQKSGDYAGKPLNNVAKHMFNASLDWQATDKLSFWTQANYRGKTSGRWQTGTSGSSTNGITYPSYKFADLGLMYKPNKDLSLKAGVYNITNKTVSTDDDYAYNLDGRRFIFALTQNF